jgi:hypothetical protein
MVMESEALHTSEIENMDILGVGSEKKLVLENKMAVCGGGMVTHKRLQNQIKYIC